MEFAPESDAEDEDESEEGEPLLLHAPASFADEDVCIRRRGLLLAPKPTKVVW